MNETNNGGIKVIKAEGGDKKRGARKAGGPRARMSRTQVITLGFFIIITLGTLL